MPWHTKIKWWSHPSTINSVWPPGGSPGVVGACVQARQGGRQAWNHQRTARECCSGRAIWSPSVLTRKHQVMETPSHRSCNAHRLSGQLAFGISETGFKTRLPQFTAVSSSAIVTGGTNPFTICGFVVASRLNLVNISKTAWHHIASETPIGQGEGSGQLSNKPQTRWTSKWSWLNF